MWASRLHHHRGESMAELTLMVSTFVVSFLIGYILISRIPPRLHTPLMSMTNAISAVTIVGGIVLFAVEIGAVQKVLGAMAIALAAFNMVGGFAITDRMLQLFGKNRTPSRSAVRSEAPKK
jgi:H+-translocating NAD(P) transhydrogenase subunit alpha